MVLPLPVTPTIPTVDFAEILAHSVYKKLAESTVIKNKLEESSIGLAV